MEAVNVVTAGLVEDQPSPMHTKEFQTLSEFQSVNLDHETGNLLKGIVNCWKKEKYVNETVLLNTSYLTDSSDLP